MRELILRGGEIVLLDDKDYEKVKDLQWRTANSNGYTGVVEVNTRLPLAFKLFGGFGVKARPKFTDGNCFNYQRKNIVITHKPMGRKPRISEKDIVQAPHCNKGSCSISPAGTLSNSFRSPECLECMNVMYTEGKSPYDKCLDIAASKHWPGWSRT